MGDAVPWVVQVFERDRKFERFQGALEAIVNRDLKSIDPDQALASLREVINIARAALEQ
jgi:hypothetical protein